MENKHQMIVIADPLSEQALEFLEQTPGISISRCFENDGPDLMAALAEADAVIVRSETKVNGGLLEHAPRLKAVGRAGVGVDNIDLEACTARGVLVMNTPGGNSIAAIELTFVLMLLTARPVAEAVVSMRNGEWNRKTFAGSELHGKTLAVFGCGKIGSGVASRAKAFGMKVVVYDPFLSNARASALGVEKVELEAALGAADFITLHLPLTDETRGFINRDKLAQIRPGLRLVNCSRGEVVVEDDLLQALDDNRVACAALDVFEHEPLPADHALRRHPKVLLTPHLGASTREAQENVGMQIAESILRVLEGHPVANALNMPPLDERTMGEIHPYLVLGETIGECTHALANRPANSIRISYFGRLAGMDTALITRAIQKGYLQHISGREVNWINAPVKLAALGISCEAVQSSEETEFADLLRLETFDADGSLIVAIDGTLHGKRRSPRIVAIDHREIEIVPEGWLLFIRNDDKPGAIGRIGNVLGRHDVNVANMALARTGAGHALTVLALDGEPPKAAFRELLGQPDIRSAQLLHINLHPA